MKDFFLGEHISQDIGKQEFEELALEIFLFQARENRVYSDYIKYLGIEPNKVQNIYEIPFLPIEFFKNHKVISRYWQLADEEFVKFRSSGTTGIVRSTHHIYNIGLYERSFLRGFEIFYGPVEQYVILALLPSYLQQGESSLVYMVSGLISMTKDSRSGFYLYNYEQLYMMLQELLGEGKKVLLIGVTFALLEFAKKYHVDGKDRLIVMETGGMKGRGKEMVREELHRILTEAFGVEKIHSEYGMTELLSQAYSQGDGVFHTPSWMRILIRDMNDPFELVAEGRSGGINVIDLANVYSCAFIETKDIGRLTKHGGFTVLGRFDNSDLRGCNLLVV